MKAAEIDNDWRASQELYKKKAPTPTKKPQNPASSSPNNHTRQNTATISKMSPAERQKCITEGLCFRCRQQGHMANDTNFHPDARQQVPPRQGQGQGARTRRAEADEGGGSRQDDEEEGRGWAVGKNSGSMGSKSADGGGSGAAVRRLGRTGPQAAEGHHAKTKSTATRVATNRFHGEMEGIHARPGGSDQPAPAANSSKLAASGGSTTGDGEVGGNGDVGGIFRDARRKWGDQWKIRIAEALDNEGF